MNGGRIDRAAMNERAQAQLKRLGLNRVCRRRGRCRTLRVARSSRSRSPRHWRSNAQAADPRRADGRARRRGNRAAVRADPQAQGGRRGVHLHQPPAGGDRADCRSHRRAARRRAHRRTARQRRRAGAHRGRAAWSAEASSGCFRRSRNAEGAGAARGRGLTAANGAFRDVSFSVAEPARSSASPG